MSELRTIATALKILDDVDLNDYLWFKEQCGKHLRLTKKQCHTRRYRRSDSFGHVIVN